MCADDPPRVLLVDDDPAVRRLLRIYLESLPSEVLEAASGPAAIAAFSRRPQAFDLLVTDIVMRDMDGVTLARRLTAERPDLPVLFTSGQGETIDELPGSAFLPKPFHRTALLERVRMLLHA